MRIVVLGGAGFVGSHVVDKLVGGDVEVAVVDDLSSCWLDSDGESPRFLNPGAELVDEEDLGRADVVVDARLRHPLGRELVLYREALDRLRSGLEICIEGALSRALRRFVVVSSLEVASDRGALGAHLRAYSEALAYLHRPPHLDVVMVHLPELYGPRQLPEAGDVAAAICGAAVSEAPSFGHLGYVGDAASVVAAQALATSEHRKTTNLVVSAPMVDEEILHKVFKVEGAEYAAERAAELERPRGDCGIPVDVVLTATALGEGLAETLEFYRWIAEEEEAGR